MLDIVDKLDEDFDLFPKSSLQQNQIKLMVIAKAKRKGKKVCPSYSAGQLNTVNFLAPKLRGFQKNRVWNCAQMG